METKKRWYVWETMTAKARERVCAESARREWGFTKGDLYDLIGDFCKAMAKGDVKKTSFICALLEDCNYHTECGRLSDGDVSGAIEWVEENFMDEEEDR